MFYCRGFTKVVSNLGVLTLCLDDKEFSHESEGFVLSNPGYYFQAVKKSDPCEFRVKLLLYTFDLCLHPITKPITLTYKEGNKYETITLLP